MNVYLHSFLIHSGMESVGSIIVGIIIVVANVVFALSLLYRDDSDCQTVLRAYVQRGSVQLSEDTDCVCAVVSRTDNNQHDNMTMTTATSAMTMMKD